MIGKGPGVYMGAQPKKSNGMKTEVEVLWSLWSNLL